MDETDKKIIEVLEKDSRTPFTKIAKMLRITETAVRKRIKKLEEAQVIKKYTIEVDPKKLGYKLDVIVGVDAEAAKLIEIAKQISEMKNVKWFYISTGDHMLIFEIWENDENSLLNTLSNKIGKIEGVKKVCPAILMEKVK